MLVRHGGVVGVVDAEGVGPQLLLLLGGVLVVAVLVLVVLRAPLFLQRVLLVLHVLQQDLAVLLVQVDQQVQLGLDVFHLRGHTGSERQSEAAERRG